MSTSDHTLVISAADDMAEIAVMDGSLSVVGDGIGRLQKVLPDGIYKVRVRVGPTVEQRLVSLDKDERLDFPPFSIPSPIPLVASSGADSDHAGAAAETSILVKESFGAGASAFVFAREQSAEGRIPHGNPAQGLSFHDEEGNELADIAQRADVRGDSKLCAGWRADLNPGPYRLRLTRPDGSAIERAVYASRGNQTQIFLLQCDFVVSDDGRTMKRVPDMSGSAVSISADQKFRPQSEGARLSEIARYALTQRRRILSDAFLQILLDWKFDDPMLGLLGAHLLLRDKPEDSDLFKVVTNNLARLLGRDHPDVRALLLARNVWRAFSGDQASATERTIKDYLGARTRAETSRVQAAPRSVFGRLSSTVNDLLGRKPAALQATPLDAEERAELIRALGVPDQVLKSILDKLSR